MLKPTHFKVNLKKYQTKFYTTLNNDNEFVKYNDNGSLTKITIWKERWFLSSNAKDIGTLYLMFALFAGLIGTAFSVLIRLELSGPGVQYISDNQLYNNIITAHAILMSAPLCFVTGLIFVIRLLNGFNQVKNIQVGKAEPYGETQTTKLNIKGGNGNSIGILGLSPELSYTTIRLTNLIHIDRYNRTFCHPILRAKSPSSGILSLVFPLNPKYGGSTRKVDTKICKNPSITSPYKELRDHLRVSYRIPNNCLIKPTGLILSGDGVVVVRAYLGRATVSNLNVKTISSKAGLNEQTMRGSVIVRSHNKNDNLVNIKRVSNMHNIVTAYELIKSKPGNMTPGVNISTHKVDNITLDGMNLEYLKLIQSKLRAGTYKFPPARIIYIPKPGKEEKRPLSIGSPRDKIVQKAIQLVLEQEYEKIFLDSSHGFRPNRGTITAMQYLEAKFQSSHYIIEADFTKAFPSIQHTKLMDILKENIKCEKLLGLIKSSLKSGYIEFGKLHENLAIGTPIGSVLSPLLCNIYLHKLDMFIEKIKLEFNKGLKRSRNKEYESLQNRVKYFKKKGYDKTKLEIFRELRLRMLNTSSIEHNDSFVRVHYVRYADDFIIGVEGSYKITYTILNKVRAFIENELILKLNPSKTGIVKYSDTPIKFLGYSLQSPYFKGVEKPRETLVVSNRTITRRKKIRIRIFMDYFKVLRRLEANGFIRKRVNHKKHSSFQYRGTFKGNLINIDHPDIIGYYNSIMRGLFNYYDFVANKPNLSNAMWLLTESCALTLARKYKLRTLKKVFAKFGKDLGYNVLQNNGKSKRISLFRLDNLKKINIISRSSINMEPLKALDKVWNAKFTKSNLFRECILCGTTQEVEMHHVKKIKGLRDKKSKLDFFTRQMAAINRKQIPLCRDHHTRLHNNTWTEEEKHIFSEKTSRRKK